MFPIREDIWSDGPNWQFGHWLNGRIGLSELGAIVTDICRRGGVEVDARQLVGVVDGYQLNGVMSLRGALDALIAAYGLYVVERDGRLVFRMDGQDPVIETDPNRLTEDGRLRTRQLLDKRPGALRLTYIDGAKAYQPGTVEARDASGDRGVVIDVTLPLV
ncbi:MAG: phage tail protein, partial [Pseudomonadota bacterium]